MHFSDMMQFMDFMDLMGFMALILLGAVTVIIVNCIKVGQTFGNMSPTEVENVTLTHSEIITECSGFVW